MIFLQLRCSVLQSLYCLCFYLVTSDKGATLRGIVLTAASVGGLQLYLQGETDTATAQTRIGHRFWKDFFCVIF